MKGNINYRFGGKVIRRATYVDDPISGHKGQQTTVKVTWADLNFRIEATLFRLAVREFSRAPLRAANATATGCCVNRPRVCVSISD